MLTDLKVKSLKPKEKMYRVRDGDKLYIEIKPTGRKFWRVRYKLRGKENVYTIGEYPTVSLYEARNERNRIAEQLAKGLSPNIEKRADAIKAQSQYDNTFKAVAQTYFDRNFKAKSAHYANQWQTVMRDDVFPVIGDMPIATIKAPYLLEIIDRIEGRNAPTVAILARQFMGQVFKYAGSRLMIESDPTVFLYGALKRGKVRHNPPIERQDMPVFFEKMADYNGFPVTIIAVYIMAHIFVRTKELVLMRWDWIKDDLIIFPEDVMKKDTKHIVPITPQVQQMLDVLSEYTGQRELMFPNVRDPKRSMSKTTINAVIERLGFGGLFSGHGFRSTASTLLNEMGYREDLIEKQLSHQERKGERRAYNHAEYLEERKAMMKEWSKFLLQFKHAEILDIAR